MTKTVICGAMSHVCIDTTFRAAKEPGFASKVISDAYATRDLKFQKETVPAHAVHAVFMATLDGMFATVITAKEYFS